MRRRLEVWIDAGDTDCILAGVPCPRILTSHFGQRWHCGLFSDAVLCDETGVPGGPGRLQRLPACLVAEIVE